MTQFSAIGHKVPRIDAGQIVTGVAQYSVDISLLGMLTGHILRSHVPHARMMTPGVRNEKPRSNQGRDRRPVD